MPDLRELNPALVRLLLHVLEKDQRATIVLSMADVAMDYAASGRHLHLLNNPAAVQKGDALFRQAQDVLLWAMQYEVMVSQVTAEDLAYLHSIAEPPPGPSNIG